jgi:hypothetical protein
LWGSRARPSSPPAITKPAPARWRCRTAGTLLAVLQGYQASEDFRGLADSTRRSYVPLIVRIEKEFGDFPLAALTDRRTRGVFMSRRLGDIHHVLLYSRPFIFLKSYKGSMRRWRVFRRVSMRCQPKGVHS